VDASLPPNNSPRFCADIGAVYLYNLAEPASGAPIVLMVFVFRLIADCMLHRVKDLALFSVVIVHSFPNSLLFNTWSYS